MGWKRADMKWYLAKYVVPSRWHLADHYQRQSKIIMRSPRRATKQQTDQELRRPSCGGKRKHSKRVAEVVPVEVVDGYETVVLQDGGFKKRKAGTNNWRIMHAWPSTQLMQEVWGRIAL